MVRLGVLHRLEADGHNSDGGRRQVFDHGDQVRLQGQSLHLTPADRLAHELWRKTVHIRTGSSTNITTNIYIHKRQSSIFLTWRLDVEPTRAFNLPAEEQVLQKGGVGPKYVRKR